MNTQGFTPVETKTLSGTDTSSSVTFTTATGGAVSQIRVVNTGANTVFLRWGTSAQTAVAATDLPVPAGAVEIFNKGHATIVAGICASGQTATVYISAGEGM